MASYSPGGGLLKCKKLEMYKSYVHVKIKKQRRQQKNFSQMFDQIFTSTSCSSNIIKMRYNLVVSVHIYLNFIGYFSLVCLVFISQFFYCIIGFCSFIDASFDLTEGAFSKDLSHLKLT